MDKLRIFAGIILLLLSTQIGIGQTEDTTKPASDNKDKVSKPSLNEAEALPENFTFKELSNGLDVLMIRDTTVPLVSVEMAFKNGAITEPKSWDGINAIYEELYFSANREYPSQEAVNKRTQKLGINPKANTGLERTNYYFTLHKAKLPYGLYFLNVATRYPKLYKGKIKAQKKEQLNKLKSALKLPTFKFDRDLKRHRWQNHFSRKNIAGTQKSLKGISKIDINSLRNRYCYPNNALLIMAGDIGVSKALSLAKNVFGNWQTSDFDIFEKYKVPEFEKLDRTRSFLTKHEKVDTPRLVFAYHGPDTRNSDGHTYTAEVFKKMLDQADVPLKKKLAKKDQAFQVDVNYKPLHHVGNLSFQLKPEPDKIKEAGRIFEEHLERWKKPGYFSREQFEDAKQAIVNQVFYERAKNSENIHKISRRWASGGIDYYANYKDNIKAVTLSDIQQFVKKYLNNSNHIRGALVSPEQKKNSEVSEIARETKPIEKYAALYALNSSDISDSADIATVRDIEHIMRINPGAQLTVHGYTDYTGPSWYNEQLSKERAQAAKELMLKWGRVSGDRIETIGHGEREKTTDPEERQKDRSARFEITFSDGDQQ